MAQGGTSEIYMFFDEAGDLNFKGNGSRVFIAGVLCARDPWPLTRELRDLRESLFRGTMIPEAFHATADRQMVRDRVFDVIAGLHDLSFHAAVTEKHEVPAAHQEPGRFYQLVADYALRAALERHPSADPVYVITDTLPVQRRREGVKKGMKASLSAVLGERRYELEHHSSAAHAGLQVADYINWALYRKWHDGDDRSSALIQHLVESERKVPWERIK
jgi:hypothetical protein